MDLTRRSFFRQTGSAALAGALFGATPAQAAEPEAAGDATLPVRAAFPGITGRVYLNSAAEHPWSRAATDALKHYADDKLSLTWEASTAAATFARLIHADADEIAYVPSTSMGEYLVTRALGLPQSGGRVVTDALHFIGSFYMYEQYRQQGLDVVTVAMDATRRIALADLDRAITPGTKLVAISHVSMYNGFTHDVKAVCEIAHARGAKVYVDLIQSAGAMAVDVKAMGVDFAGCGTYKWLMGDFGFAFLYVRKDLLPQLQRPWYGYRQTRNFAAPITHIYPLDAPGKLPYVSEPIDSVSGYFAGAFPARALDAACTASMNWIMRIGVNAIAAYRQPLLQALHEGLQRKGFDVVTPRDSRSPIVAFAYEDAARLAPRLEPAKVEITLRHNQARISPSLFNDLDDIQLFLDAIGKP
ncbi:aminotransferase class V-fold PLP-dependent enzyme [Solimonas marina]|uniref:Aminotransferase class V-fold PLP-dependent enzyme n=1 Tax=Solimonas marina TaxID=2714601 RepID=A0A970B4S3_9GAMM|nr:aminotransferase class V-fold PLP-dependent enzyme [Solimonas marina]NKF20933.1 aminotransferase class V-fold PLP-dependent enzyme [Solimonas marina]